MRTTVRPTQRVLEAESPAARIDPSAVDNPTLHSIHLGQGHLL